MEKLIDESNLEVTKKSKAKKVTLRAFEVKNSSLTQASSNAKPLLLKKLDELKAAKNRCMILNHEDPNQERDLISYFKEAAASNSVFCTMLRISSDSDVQHITDSLFEREFFTMDEIDNEHIDTSAICKSHYYFSLSDDFLVTNLPGNKTITRLQTYLSWFTNNELLELTPAISATDKTLLSDLKGIVVKDPDPIGEGSSNSGASPSPAGTAMAESSKTIKLTDQVLELLKKSISGTKTFDEIAFGQMISAELLIKFNKPRKMSIQEYQKVLGAYLKPVSDLDNVTFKRKDGKSEVKGRDLLRTQTVEIETTQSGKIVEQHLLQEMSRFLLELKNEKNGS
ncbi:hypothetical protein [Serratia marcescens]|uniref:hypothetical protein n=1 Tax=Serratia marcescens TaxID=615 RepID=UPI000B61B670|nr:hypothetical protein [Serratia marcescens]ASM07381.1 hypothetical protein BVG91_10260 [Serratia marcescens]